MIDFSNLEIKMPVLANFIIDNATDDMSPIDVALHLKNEGPVVKYRDYLNEIDSALEQQNWKELRHLIRCSDDAVNSVIAMDKKRLNEIRISIFPTPTITIGSINTTATISSSPSLSITGLDKIFKKFNLVFLKDLTKYAINDMHI